MKKKWVVARGGGERRVLEVPFHPITGELLCLDTNFAVLETSLHLSLYD
jgi:hypothetical protein